jgi:hypothetical protein
MFFVETEKLKKYRGYSIIKSNIFLFERATGKSTLLISQKMLLPKHKDIVLGFKENIDSFYLRKLENGDSVFLNDVSINSKFNNLMSYKSVYNSYILSKNKLIKN